MLSLPITALLLTAGQAQAVSVPEGSIALDARADEFAWQQARFADGFVQYDPDAGAPASERTRLKVAYDPEALYLYVEAADSQPEMILAQLTRRDSSSVSDWIHVWLDTHDDDRTAYRFSVNPANVQQDARVVDDGREDSSWNAVWESSTRTSSAGWSAEMRIPLSQLRYEEGRSRWGFQVGRNLRRRNELSYFSPRPRGSNRVVSHFGSLEGMAQLPAAWDVSATPYVSGAVGRASAESSVWATAGADVHVGLGLPLTHKSCHI